jgi:hypothetical protein
MDGIITCPPSLDPDLTRMCGVTWWGLGGGFVKDTWLWVEWWREEISGKLQQNFVLG